MTIDTANFYIGIWVGGAACAIGFLALGFDEEARERRLLESGVLMRTNDVTGKSILLPVPPKTVTNWVFITNTVTIMEQCKREHSHPDLRLPFKEPMPFFEPQWTNGYWYVPNASAITNIDAGVYTNTTTIGLVMGTTNVAYQHEPSKKQVIEWLEKHIE